MFSNRLVLALIALAFSAAGALGQVAQTGGGLPTPTAGGGGAYTAGPGNVVASATAWYGLRAYTVALANAGATITPVIDVAGSSTGSCTIYLKGDGTGGLDFTTAGAGSVGHQCLLGATTFCIVTNTSCTVSKFYDQSGGGVNLVQATGAAQPALTFNCVGSLPCLTFNGTSSAMTNSGGVTVDSQPFVYSSVAKSLTNGAQSNFVYDGNVQIGYNDGGSHANTAFLYDGSVFRATASDNVYHSLIGVFNNASSVFYVDDIPTSGTVGSVAPTGGAFFLGSAGGGQFLKGTVLETGLWGVTFSAGQAASMCRNQQAYYGNANFGTSCAPYVGPGDIVTGATYWFGLRAYNNTLANAGVTTTKVIDVAGSSSGSCTIFLNGDGTGGLDLTTAGAGGIGNQCLLGATTFCTVTNTSCSVSKWYDQTGNGYHVIQATGGNQPVFTFSCIGSLQCLAFNGTSDVLANGSLTVNANPTSFSMVLSKTSGTSQTSIFYDGVDQMGVFFGGSGSAAFFYNGTGFNLGTFSVGTNHAMQLMWGLMAGSNIDGAATTPAFIEYSPAGVNSINLGSAGGGQFLNGAMTEFGEWSQVSFSTTQQNSLCKNQQAYYGSGNFGAVC